MYQVGFFFLLFPPVISAKLALDYTKSKKTNKHQNQKRAGLALNDRSLLRCRALDCEARSFRLTSPEQ